MSTCTPQQLAGGQWSAPLTRRPREHDRLGVCAALIVLILVAGRARAERSDAESLRKLSLGRVCVDLDDPRVEKVMRARCIQQL